MISVLLPSFAGGGAERVMISIANGLANDGHPVSLLVCDASGPLSDFVSKDVEIVDFKKPRVARSLLPLSLFLSKSKTTVLITAMSHTNLIATIAKMISAQPVRLILTEHASMELWGGPGFFKRWGLRVALRFAYVRADKVVAVSRGLAEALVCRYSLPAGIVKVIYNPVVSESFLEQSSQIVEHPWFMNPSTPVIVGVGRLETVKRFDHLISAFKLVRNKWDARLVIIGSGSLESTLQEQVKNLDLQNFVEFIGFTKNPGKFIARANVFVQTSESEGLGNTLIEAMVLGTPVVATDCNYGPREILEHGTWGRLVEIGDISGIADAIDLALRRSHRGEAVSRAQKFTYSRALEEYKAIILER